MPRNDLRICTVTKEASRMCCRFNGPGEFRRNSAQKTRTAASGSVCRPGAVYGESRLPSDRHHRPRQYCHRETTGKQQHDDRLFPGLAPTPASRYHCCCHTKHGDGRSDRNGPWKSHPSRQHTAARFNISSAAGKCGHGKGS